MKWNISYRIPRGQPCLFCGMDEVRDLNQHLQDYHWDECFQCGICFPTVKLFHFIADVLSHFIEYHGISVPDQKYQLFMPRSLGLMSCSFCVPPKHFLGKPLDDLFMDMFRHLETHDEVHNGEEEMIRCGMSVRCRLCVEHFLERDEFARHIEAHAESLENNGVDPSIKSCGLKLQFVNNQRSPGKETEDAERGRRQSHESEHTTRSQSSSGRRGSHGACGRDKPRETDGTSRTERRDDDKYHRGEEQDRSDGTKRSHSRAHERLKNDDPRRGRDSYRRKHRRYMSQDGDGRKASEIGDDQAYEKKYNMDSRRNTSLDDRRELTKRSRYECSVEEKLLIKRRREYRTPSHGTRHKSRDSYRSKRYQQQDTSKNGNAEFANFRSCRKGRKMSSGRDPSWEDDVPLRASTPVDLADSPGDFICRSCSLPFSGIDDALTHLTEVHDKTGTRNEIYRELEAPPGLVVISCKVCDFREICVKSNVRLAARAHYVSHPGTVTSIVESFRVECRICCFTQNSLREIKALQNHIEDHVLEEKTDLVCGFCLEGLSAAEDKLEDSHYTDKHIHDLFSCILCSKVFGLNMEAVLHLQDAHSIAPHASSSSISRPTTGFKCYTCLICYQRFYNRNIGDLSDHFTEKHKIQYDPSRVQFSCRMCTHASLKGTAQLDHHIYTAHSNGSSTKMRSLQLKWICKDCRWSNKAEKRVCSGCEYRRPIHSRLELAPKKVTFPPKTSRAEKNSGNKENTGPGNTPGNMRNAEPVNTPGNMKNTGPVNTPCNKKKAEPVNTPGNMKNNEPVNTPCNKKKAEPVNTPGNMKKNEPVKTPCNMKNT